MTRTLLLAAGLALASTANAQFFSDFEAPTYAGSAGGTALTNGFGLGGQDGWYNPVNGSTDGVVFEYSGNSWGFVNNPTGGAQFGAVRNQGATGFGRAQHAVDFSGNTYTAAFDICMDRFGGVLPALNNLGSFSLQPSGSGAFWQTLYTWDDLSTGNAFDANYIFFNAAGVQQASTLPGAEWDALRLNTWYRQSTTWNFATNQILSVSIDNLHDPAGPTVVDVSGLGWYLAGGTAGRPRPTDVRFFAGGGANNVHIFGFDNLEIVPAPASVALLALGGLVGGRRRRA
ncbi:MAG: PEP-CTERM sorting domain-containing protein [Phycisphaerales bacterium]|nr:PEP-CTERM sorting domain-containing protein [Phycisphaerales bacterium]MCB9840436.1 PEP-CTERM sorting domain-containing protein [Phycisphaeraceae bacterium]